MIGTVWHYDERMQRGYIIGHNNQRYDFSRIDYRNAQDPPEGSMVEFTVAVGKVAKNITKTQQKALW